jgi:Raf kinase inhibitor-like YbhB/YbcL family protein
MNNSRRLAGIGILSAFAAGSLFAQTAPAGATAAPGGSGRGGRGPAGPGLTLTSPAFEDGGIIPAKFTQSDPNPVSPKLEWTNVPATAVAFVLIMHDPDTAPQRKSEDILHWMVINIPGTTHELPEGVPNIAQLPDGSWQPKALNGKNGFMGPGAGAAGPYHHYTLELYALDVKLDATAETPRADVLKAMDGHVVAKAALVGRFHR